MWWSKKFHHMQNSSGTKNARVVDPTCSVILSRKSADGIEVKYGSPFQSCLSDFIGQDVVNRFDAFYQFSQNVCLIDILNDDRYVSCCRSIEQICKGGFANTDRQRNVSQALKRRVKVGIFFADTRMTCFEKFPTSEKLFFQKSENTGTYYMQSNTTDNRQTKFENRYYAGTRYQVCRFHV